MGDEVEGKWIAATNENEVIARDNRLLLEKVNALEVEKNLRNENEISVSTITDMQASMDEMKCSYEEICTRTDVISKKNQVLSGDNEELKLSNAVLQAEK